MKLTNLQREIIVKNIYNEIVQSQKDYVQSEVDKQLAKRIAEYKKTVEYKTYLKLKEISDLEGVQVTVGRESGFNTNTSCYSHSLKDLENLLTFKIEQELKTTLKTPDKQVIEDKLVLSSITGFDFEEFKKSILADFAI